LNREPLFFCTQNFPFPQPVFSQTATALPLAKKPEALLSATTIQPPSSLSQLFPSSSRPSLSGNTDRDRLLHLPTAAGHSNRPAAASPQPAASPNCRCYHQERRPSFPPPQHCQQPLPSPPQLQQPQVTAAKTTEADDQTSRFLLHQRRPSPSHTAAAILPPFASYPKRRGRQATHRRADLQI